MNNSVSTFTFNTHDIRVIDQEGNPWFVVKDVLTVLDLGGTTMALANTSAADVCDFKVPGQSGRPNKIINESGLYKLIFQSRKPEARAFQDWVTRDVLPAIRKDGA